MKWSFSITVSIEGTDSPPFASMVEAQRYFEKRFPIEKTKKLNENQLAIISDGEVAKTSATNDIIVPIAKPPAVPEEP